MTTNPNPTRLQRARELADLIPAKPGDPASPNWGGMESDQLAYELMSHDLPSVAVAVANLLLWAAEREEDAKSVARAESVKPSERIAQLYKERLREAFDGDHDSRCRQAIIAYLDEQAAASHQDEDPRCPGCHKPFDSPDHDPRCSSCAESGTGPEPAAAHPVPVAAVGEEKPDEWQGRQAEYWWGKWLSEAKVSHGGLLRLDEALAKLAASEAKYSELKAFHDNMLDALARNPSEAKKEHDAAVATIDICVTELSDRLTASEARCGQLTGELADSEGQRMQLAANVHALLAQTGPRFPLYCAYCNGCASPVDHQSGHHRQWLEWKAGLAAPSAREDTTVDRALDYIPLLRDAVDCADGLGPANKRDAAKALTAVRDALLESRHRCEQLTGELGEWQASYANQKRCHCELQRVLSTKLTESEAAVARLREELGKRETVVEAAQAWSTAELRNLAKQGSPDGMAAEIEMASAKRDLRKALSALELHVSLDAAHEVVMIRRAGARVVLSRDADHDTHLFLDLDDQDHVVGVRLTAANEMPPDYWKRHPDRGSLPGDILSKLDELIQQLYAEAIASGVTKTQFVELPDLIKQFQAAAPDAFADLDEALDSIREPAIEPRAKGREILTNSKWMLGAHMVEVSGSDCEYTHYVFVEGQGMVGTGTYKTSYFCQEATHVSDPPPVSGSGEPVVGSGS